MTDIVKRMKARVEQWRNEEPEADWWTYQYEYAAAADRIEALEAENARFRKALDGLLHMWSSRTVDEARKALGGEHD